VLSRMARKKSPAAPKWRNTEVTLRARGTLGVWKSTFNG
jgi:hypothetical protein